MYLYRSVQLAHAQMFARERVLKLTYPKKPLVTRTIPTGTTEANLTALFSQTLPSQLMVLFANNANLAGTYTTNPYHFQNFGIRHIVLRVDGEEFPRGGYKMNYANSDYTAAWTKTLNGLALDGEAGAIDLTPGAWANDFNCYVFNINPCATEGISAVKRSGNSELHIEFSAATAVVISMLMYSIDDGMVEIDNMRNVLMA